MTNNNDFTPEIRNKTLAWTISGCVLLAVMAFAFVSNYNSATPITLQSIVYNRQLGKIESIENEMKLVKRQMKRNITVNVGVTGTSAKFNLGKMEELNERYKELSKQLAEAKENLNK